MTIPVWKRRVERWIDTVIAAVRSATLESKPDDTTQPTQRSAPSGLVT